MALKEIIRPAPAEDGAGVSIRRIGGNMMHSSLDPFLMIDEIRSNDESDYMAGFPPHPHRGFETITYLLKGHMKHEDHMGNVGIMRDGGVQWMTAGRGVIHSEMPEQTSGVFHGLQVWLNLPSELKMTAPAYVEIPPQSMEVQQKQDFTLRVIAGELSINGESIQAPLPGESRARAAVADLNMRPGASVKLDAGRHRRLFVYIYQGAEVEIGGDRLGCFEPGSATLTATGEGLSALVLAGEPLSEPVVQYGPFVMNTREQVEQAIRDYSAGTLVD